jgi:hypothetical protein
VTFLIGGTMPWYCNSNPSLSEDDANKLFSKYVIYADEGNYEKIKNLYSDYYSCGNCQQDIKSLKSFKGNKIKVVNKKFSSKTNSLKVKLEFSTGSYYEPTFHFSMLRIRWIPLCKIYRTRIKEVSS